MSAAFVQNGTGNALGSPTTVATGNGVGAAIPSAITAGNLLLVLVVSNAGSTGDHSAPTDTPGNTYTKLLEFTTLNNDISVWAAWNCLGGSSPVVTAHVGVVGCTAASMVFQEFSGMMKSANPKDLTHTSTGGTTSPASGSTGTTNQATELIVGVVGVESIVTTISSGSGYSNMTKIEVTNVSAAMESKVVSSTGTQSASFSLLVAHQWGCGVLTLKDAAGDPKAKGGTLTLMGIG